MASTRTPSKRTGTAAVSYTHLEAEGSRKVLKAAAMTYVAAAVSAILNLLRLVLIARDRDRD